MASNTSRPEGLRKIGSTTEDSVNRVGVLEYFNLDRGVATFRGIEGGSGITVTLVDADGSPNTTGSVIRITGSGGGGGGTGSIWYTGAGAPGAGLGVETDLYMNTTNGDYYQKGPSAWVLKGNLRGPTGAAGATGAQGPIGATGDSAYDIAVDLGFSGTESQWLASLVGPQGPAGADGAPGTPGTAGPQGIQGEVGPQGPQGPAGADGEAGPQGIQGIQGEIGPQGIQGIQGPIGPVGPAGADGTDGIDGTSFAVKGSVDDVSELPTTGNTNGDAWLVDGDLYVWNDTQFDNAGPLQGPAGPTGPTGPQGIQGEIGPVGPQGPQGIQGVQGDAGAAGATGPQGIQGEIGPQGPQGIQGIQGEIGPQGPAGPAGADGDDGAPGAAGADGADGEDGVGVPAGGTTGQVLAKNSDTDFDTEWVDAATGGSVTVTDTNSVDLTLTGSALSAAVKRSATAGNAITENGDGLYVATVTPGIASVTHSDSTTIDFTGAGTSASALVAAVKVSANVGNLITTETDGLHVAASSTTVSTTDSTSIDFSGAGTVGSPLTASAIVSPTAGNTLSATGNGLYVPTVTTTSSDTATIDFSGSGTAGSPLTADVKRSTAVANNRITAQSDGLHVAPVAIQDAGSVITANPSAINFTGSNITVTDVAGVATVAVSAGALPVQDEGSVVQATPTAINFTGAGVTATNVGGVATVNIPGGAASGPEAFTFRLVYTGSGISSVDNLPAGWTVSITTGTPGTATITHNLTKRVSAFSAVGNGGPSGVLQTKPGTGAFGAQMSSDLNSFTVVGATLTASGAASGGFAYIDITLV